MGRASTSRARRSTSREDGRTRRSRRFHTTWDVNRWDDLNLFFGGVQAVEQTAELSFEAAGDPRRGGLGIVVA